MCSRQVRTLTRAAPGGSARISFASPMSTMTSGRTGIEAPNDATGEGSRSVVSTSFPACTQWSNPPSRMRTSSTPAYVQDERRAGRGDLPCAPTRPLLVRAPLGVAAVEDDRRVVRDAEALHRLLELGRRSAVPVDGVLEPVRVEVERAGKVALLVLLGHAEVDVEEEEAVAWRGLRTLAVEHGTEPVDVDEALVPRKPLEGEGLVLEPRIPVFVRPDARVVERREPRRKGGRVVAVEHDLTVGGHAFRHEHVAEVGVVEEPLPLAGKRDRAGDVAAAGGAVGAPAVEQVEWPGVDDRECGFVQAPAELLGHARLLSHFTSGSFETIQSEVRSQAMRFQACAD